MVSRNHRRGGLNGFAITAAAVSMVLRNHRRFRDQRRGGNPETIQIVQIVEILQYLGISLFNFPNTFSSKSTYNQKNMTL